jgi:hypothetical protein
LAIYKLKLPLYALNKAVVIVEGVRFDGNHIGKRKRLDFNNQMY